MSKSKYRAYCKDPIHGFDSRGWYDINISVIKNSDKIMVFGKQEDTGEQKSATVDMDQLFNHFRIQHWDEKDIREKIEVRRIFWDEGPE